MFIRKNGNHCFDSVVSDFNNINPFTSDTTAGNFVVKKIIVENTMYDMKLLVKRIGMVCT